MNNTFDIIHFSYRVRGILSKELESSMEAKVNIVFRIDKEDEYLKRRCDRLSSEFSQVTTISSIDDYKTYLSNLEQITNLESWLNENDEYGKIFTNHYTVNDNPLLTYIPKFDVYCFREWVDWCPATQGIIKEIEFLRKENNWSSCSSGCHFLRCLQSLDIFWS